MPRRGQAPSPSLRSNSAIDLQAAQRAKARAQYAALARQKVGSGASLRKCQDLEVSFWCAFDFMLPIILLIASLSCPGLTSLASK